ncbi:MAG: hypothetical protein JSU98_01905 [Gemmatimonadales bacterium]|jgi:hypothetical protein|nr:MAG: hypothetical protein JSU98_01905 [Gemmatimonadales bacterium]
MAHEIRRVEYFHTTVPDRPGEAFRFLSALADAGVNLLAFTAIPMGIFQTQLTIFPDDPGRLQAEGGRLRLDLDGPHGALLVRGADVPGALVEVHERLYDAGVNVYAANGVAGSEGRYGYVIYVRPEEMSRATEALGV